MNTLLANAKLGDQGALNSLWDQYSQAVSRAVHKAYARHTGMFNRKGIQLEDLEQEGYLAFRHAVDNFSGSELEEFAPYLFATLKYWVLSLDGGHYGCRRRQTRTADGKTISRSAEPLDARLSSDAPMQGDGSKARTFYDTQADPNAEIAYEIAENRICAEELHEYIEDAMAELPEREQEVLRAIYYKDLTRQEAARLLCMDSMALHRQEIAGLYRLRCKQTMQWCWDEYICCRAWRGTGFHAWKDRGSIQERIAESIELAERKARKKQKPFL